MPSQTLDKKIQAPQEILSELLQKAPKKKTSLQLEKIFAPGYEQVIQVTDPSCGLRAIIAIHNTALGPSLGGIRIQPYATFEAALEDVLRLSKGMTYKSAVAGVGFGGGKSVILADPRTEKTPERLHSFGKAVEQLQGWYICAEDVGCTPQDVQIVQEETQYVVGLAHAKSSGDPGPFTAWGTLRGIQAALKKIYGSDAIEGRTIAVQGLGSVGSHLLEGLFWAGARLLIADMDGQKAQRLAKRYGAQVVSPDEILFASCDVLAPCALGGILNEQTIPLLRCRAVAGSANNQLLKDTDAQLLKERGILYAPDFVINAGGLLNVSAELDETGYLPAKPRAQSHRIYDTLLSIFEIAEKNKETTHNAALALAEYRIRYGVGKRTQPPVFHHSLKN